MSRAPITATQHERRAYVYVRQSTLWQVSEHQESTERQYRLQERAQELGWPPTAIAVIDEDQGRSGSSATARTGFQRLVSEVSLGQVGIVLMLEASRLARNSSDWHRLIELCGLSQTLLADEDAIYDPRDPNDRLLLGVKGTLSEAELFTLRTRLYEGRWNKARKGLLAFSVPVGFVAATTGTWELDPDQQVRERLAYLFATFRRLGVARQVVREFTRQGLDLPTRAVDKGAYGILQWKAPTLGAVVRLLENPAYAGVYVYGRWEYLAQQRSPTTGKARVRRRPPDQWPVLIQEHHPAYVSWEEFMRTQDQLRQNWQHEGNRGVARDGAALLQGIVWCGFCGRKMGVQHHSTTEKRSSAYLCHLGQQQEGHERLCQSMTARPVDAAVTRAFLEAVSPLGIEVAAAVLDQAEQQLLAQRRQWEVQLEQARYEARLAQRKYDAVDPDNRLVAAELERRWNAQLTRVAELEQAAAKAEQEARWTLRAEERAAMQTLAQDLSTIWHAETTTSAERKQLLRLAIEAVHLDGVSRPRWIEVQIRWRSGVVTRLEVPRVKPGEGSLKTPAPAVARIHELAAEASYADVAGALNAAGWRTAFGRPFTSQHVGYICRRDGCGRRRARALPSSLSKQKGGGQPSGPGRILGEQ
jgi:DNA invertase Pin-like site-specific DNA recombinase